jgi:S-adenosylmethionine:tRNA ribosyltransferase-isomerase
MSSRLADYYYELPAELIAARPLPRREDARMMVLHRLQQRIEHRRFLELPEFLGPDDLLVLNNTRVLPARRFSDDGAIEFLFLERLDRARWTCLVRPGRRMRVGAAVRVAGKVGHVEAINAAGERIVAFEEEWNPHQGGLLPLPPYLNRQGDSEDETRYQTVFAEFPGALAAPTAGLHFTREILGVIPHTFITLHVGTGTFRPVQVDNLADHRMHAERFSVSAPAAEAINHASRIVAVGTTTVRVLESARCVAGKIIAQEGETDSFIYPPYEFRAVDLLLTNFHLPRSTLLMLVSAFAGREFVLAAYEEAIRERYRFFSYGDCMLII